MVRFGEFPQQFLQPLVAEGVETTGGENGLQRPPPTEDVDGRAVGQFGTPVDPLPLRPDLSKNAPILLQERQLDRVLQARGQA